MTHFSTSAPSCRYVIASSTQCCNIDHLWVHTGIDTLADITSYLYSLEKTEVFNLGLVLGLEYNRLKAMRASPNFLQDTIAGWLQGVDQVLRVGVPTWKRLVEALKDPRVCQNELAIMIEQHKQDGIL